MWVQKNSGVFQQSTALTQIEVVFIRIMIITRIVTKSLQIFIRL